MRILLPNLSETGGNFPGFKRLMPGYFDLSHPIAEIDWDGTSVITKHPDQNGLVSVETVKTQFLYVAYL